MGVNARAILTGETATLDLLEFIYGCKASSNVRLVPTGDGGFRLCLTGLMKSICFRSMITEVAKETMRIFTRTKAPYISLRC